MPSLRGFGSLEAQTYADLELRSRWGGLSGLPALTPAEAELFCRLRRARSDWFPQRALWYAWRHVDPRRWDGGRPLELGDPRYGAAWTLAEFRAALADDAVDIDAVIHEHPDQGHRLRDWRRRMERLGDERENDSDTRDGVGYYYDALGALGYCALDLEQRKRRGQLFKKR